MSPAALALAAPTPGAAPSASPSAGATLNDPGIYTISGQNLDLESEKRRFHDSERREVHAAGDGRDRRSRDRQFDYEEREDYRPRHRAQRETGLDDRYHGQDRIQRAANIDERRARRRRSNEKLHGDRQREVHARHESRDCRRGVSSIELKHMLVLTGNVHIDDTATGQSMIADNVTYDTASETVTATGKPGEPFQIRAPVQTAPPGTPGPTKPPKNGDKHAAALRRCGRAAAFAQAASAGVRRSRRGCARARSTSSSDKNISSVRAARCGARSNRTPFPSMILWGPPGTRQDDARRDHRSDDRRALRGALSRKRRRCRSAQSRRGRARAAKDRPPHRAVHRRDPSLQQSAARRGAAATSRTERSR